jgi:exodeoxyribonuclease-3
MQGYWCYWHGAAGYSGVGLHVSKDIAPERPLFTIVSVYVPNGGKDFPAKMQFLEALAGYARDFQGAGRPLVICGDLNVARTDRDVHPKERKPRAIGQLPEERAVLEQLIGHGLVDLGRTVDPDNDNLFTWWAPWRQMRERNIGWRLDYVLTSEALAGRAISCPVLKEIGTSDHAPVLATFDYGFRNQELGMTN